MLSRRGDRPQLSLHFALCVVGFLIDSNSLSLRATWPRWFRRSPVQKRSRLRWDASVNVAGVSLEPWTVQGQRWTQEREASCTAGGCCSQFDTDTKRIQKVSWDWAVGFFWMYFLPLFASLLFWDPALPTDVRLKANLLDMGDPSPAPAPAAPAQGGWGAWTQKWNPKGKQIHRWEILLDFLGKLEKRLYLVYWQWRIVC